MSKRQSKKKRKPRTTRRRRPARQPPPELQASLDRAESLIVDGRAKEAMDLLEPWLDSHSRVAHLHYCYGSACAMTGNLWAGLAGCERAMKLSGDPDHWLPLAWLYLDLEMNAHALQAFRRALARGVASRELDDIREVTVHLEERVGEMARGLRLPVDQVEQGLRYQETGSRALQQRDYTAAIAANRRAIKLMPTWPPPYNNLALALFFDGQPQKAIAVARQVLSWTLDNVHALANAIRFLALTGQGLDARLLWPQLRAVETQDPGTRLKMAEAAAVLNEDEFVCQVLGPLERVGTEYPLAPALLQRARFFQAVAEANLGKRSARRRFEALSGSQFDVSEYLEAMEAGKPGLGWADRYPYFPLSELISLSTLERIIELGERQGKIPDWRFRKQMARYLERYPQVLLVAERIIWEHRQPDVGVALLEMMGTPAAYALLRRFGLSQAGDDEERMQALTILSEAGEIAPDETLLFWSKGEWGEIQLRMYEVSGERSLDYAQEVVDLLDRGSLVLEEGDADQAERLFRRVLALEPTVKEAYNNLGVLYGRRGDTDQAVEMCRAALELDPLYVVPRCNLALYLLDQDDPEGAREMLRPLADVTHYHALDMAFYTYVQARIHVYDEDYEQARRDLEVALEVYPGYELAEDLLSRLNAATDIRDTYDAYLEQQRKRDQAHRARLQAKLSTADPALAEALALYTKEVLTGMAYLVLASGGWSALRKAELLETIVEGLKNPYNLARLAEQLDGTEQAALRSVLARGGHRPWHDFDAEYGNDLEESRYWQWHEPETTMGRLRHRGFLVEATVVGELLIVVPWELRQSLGEILGA